MNELTYFEAWSLWSDGHSISDKLLWGLTILWWGRLGKMISLLAVFTIVAEIIGPQRLRDTGTELRQRFNLSQVKTIGDSTFSTYRLLIRRFLTSGEHGQVAFDKFNETTLGKITMTL